ncbi:acetolactate decarboxylase [Methanolobus sp. WCC5]|uniref:acetolactate decarboxylase n=1 Tax=Methanolobus sp. WCC5 TaxID=3125785 RepID=UPI003243F417
MRTRILHFILLLAILSVLTGGCISDQPVNNIPDQSMDEVGNTAPDADRDTIYQFSTINALLEGVYEGEISCGELKEKGDFGLGTFDDLDGEMLKLDGIIYQIRADGNVYEAEDSVTSPFAAVTFFETDIKDTVAGQMDSRQMAEYIERLLPSHNVMYAVKITGNFDYMETRSVAAQQRPYPRLVDVTKDQSVFEFNDTEGTIVGYWLPEYVSGINVPGYHLHYITKDRTGGGHILDYIISSGTIEIDSTDKLYLELPVNEDYLNMGFSQDLGAELEEAEN